MRYVAAAALLLLAGCADSADGGDETEEPIADEGQPEMTAIGLTLVTDSGSIAMNEDHELCLWGDTSVTIRDQSGDVVGADTSRLSGTVTSSDPYSCETSLDLEVEPSDFYEIEVETARLTLRDDTPPPVTASQTVAQDEAHAVTIEVN